MNLRQSNYNANNVNQIQILGINDCVNCTYNWSSSGQNGLATGTVGSKFPTIDRGQWPEAFDNTYYVEVNTPEGCVIHDTVFVEVVKGINEPEGVNANLIINPCEIQINVDFEYLGEDFPVIKITNTISGEVFNLDPDMEMSNDVNKFYTITLDRTEDYDFILDASTIYNDDESNSESNCIIGTCLIQPIGSVLSAPQSSFCVFWPNVMAPNAQNPADRVFHPYIDGCAGDFTSPYFISLAIFNRFGNRMHDVNTENITRPVNGYTGAEVQWDGIFNGQPVGAGVYSYIATISSCGPTECSNGGCTGEQLYTGEFTLVR